MKNWALFWSLGIIWGSSLSYLGFGAVVPSSEWGLMLAQGKTYLTQAWWLTVFPGVFIALTSIAATVLGNSIEARRRRQ